MKKKVGIILGVVAGIGVVACIKKVFRGKDKSARNNGDTVFCENYEQWVGDLE